MTISTSLWNHVTAGSWRANHLMCIQDGISPNRHLHHRKAIPKVWKQQRSRPFIWAGQRKQSSFLSNLLLGWLGWLPVWPSVQCKMMMSQKEINSATGSKLYSVQVVHVYYKQLTDEAYCFWSLWCFSAVLCLTIKIWWLHGWPSKTQYR